MLGKKPHMPMAQQGDGPSGEMEMEEAAAS